MMMTVSASETEKCFAFIIPVRNPLDKKVNDYKTIEALLRTTIDSLLRQTNRNVVVVVVCHSIPGWAPEADSRVRFLDVSNDKVFGPDQNHVVIDKGLKYTIGVLYARSCFEPELVMLLDADDYVNITLADHLLSGHADEGDIDGYMINKGVHVGTSVAKDYNVRFGFAVVVENFDHTCGSCRVFDAQRLVGRLKGIDATIVDRFAVWSEPDPRRSLKVGDDQIEWLGSTANTTREDKGNIVDLLGRHTRQGGHFALRYLDLIGAAKGCGHGNHDGPRRGAVHWTRVTRNMSIREFLATFGLPKQRWSLTSWARRRAKAVDKKAGRVWADKYMKNQ